MSQVNLSLAQAETVVNDGLLIRLEREIEADTEVTQIRLSTQFCKLCGTRLIGGKCGYCDEPGACGNYTRDEVLEMRYPNW